MTERILYGFEHILDLLSPLFNAEDPDAHLAEWLVYNNRESLDALPREMRNYAYDVCLKKYFNGEEPLISRKALTQKMISGQVLWYLYQMTQERIHEPSLSKAQWLTSAYVRICVHRMGWPQVGHSVKSVQKYWRENRSVAHLWAIYGALSFSNDHVVKTINKDKVYFLALVKRLQDFADEYVPVREKNPEPLLPKDAWRVSESIAPADLKTAPLERWQLDALEQYKHG